MGIQHDDEEGLLVMQRKAVRGRKPSPSLQGCIHGVLGAASPASPPHTMLAMKRISN
jgi:hypothetical protein